MNRIKIVLLGVATLVLVVTVGALASAVGGVSIRSASRTHVIGNLSLSSDTLLPGVPTGVTVSGLEEPVQTATVLVVRLPESNVVVGPIDSVDLQRGTFNFLVPCSGGAVSEDGQFARLVLVENGSQAVLAQSERVVLLPPGPDCIR